MDVDAIIAAVRRRPAIWDISNKYYKNKTVVKTMWDEIALELNCESDFLRVKWKNLRDYYRSELKKLHKLENIQGEGSTVASVWPYMESMSFVKHLVNTRGQMSSAESKINFVKCEPNDDVNEVEFENECDEEENSTNMEDDETAVNDTFQATLSTALHTGPSPLVTNMSSRLQSLLESGTKRSSTPVETSKGQMAKKKKLSVHEEPQSESDDGDLLFLKSLLPDIKTLPRARRLQLRLKFQELVCKAIEEAEASAFIRMSYSNKVSQTL